MKNILPALSLLMLVFTQFSCLKDNTCTSKTVASERNAMLNFAATNGLTVTEHSSGLMYEIVTPGSSPVPTINSVVSCRYVGKLLNGTIFDSSTSSALTIPLNSVIAGWQIGIPLIAKGGSIRLIIPSSLAYGCRAVGTVPANSILYFEIDLDDVQ